MSEAVGSWNIWKRRVDTIEGDGGLSSCDLKSDAEVVRRVHTKSEERRGWCRMWVMIALRLGCNLRAASTEGHNLRVHKR